MSEQLTQRIEASAGVTGLLFVVAYAALSLTAIALVGPYGWDDGAITVAYAHTLGRHGIFALTPASALAEGTSSLLMTAMLALGEWLLHPDFLEAITAAQLLAFIALSATLVLVWRALQPSLPSPTQRLVVVCVLGLLPTCQAEIVNGMEMTVFALLLFAFVLAWRARSPLAYALVPLLMLTRFEAVFYLGFALGWMVLFCRQDRPLAIRMCVWLVLCFLLLTIWRYWVFGALLPNTILAKLQVPYSKKGWDGVLEKLRGLKDPPGECRAAGWHVREPEGRPKAPSGSNARASDIFLWRIRTRIGKKLGLYRTDVRGRAAHFHSFSCGTFCEYASTPRIARARAVPLRNLPVQLCGAARKHRHGDSRCGDAWRAAHCAERHERHGPKASVAPVPR
ncbi:hypothetical protein [Caballeronia glebae]|uniref:hypothetical protein n=1 Tax=Caballeronia glebae TaxID=1777143 RepID=UPI001F25ACE2|nr:hypothetical protein [Caballeronia glebae]